MENKFRVMQLSKWLTKTNKKILHDNATFWQNYFVFVLLYICRDDEYYITI